MPVGSRHVLCPLDSTTTASHPVWVADASGPTVLTIPRRLAFILAWPRPMVHSTTVQKAGGGSIRSSTRTLLACACAPDVYREASRRSWVPRRPSASASPLRRDGARIRAMQSDLGLRVRVAPTCFVDRCRPADGALPGTNVGEICGHGAVRASVRAAVLQTGLSRSCAGVSRMRLRSLGV